MVKVLLDTNVLINADRGEFSHPKRILDLVTIGKITAIISRAVRRENELIIDKLINDGKLQKDLQNYLSLAKEVEPVQVTVELEDEEDIKLLETAVGGSAQFLITDDRHLLEVGECGGVRILNPKQFWQWWEKQQDESGENWNSWANSIFR